MRIARLTLNNWICYRGEQTIEFGPKVYAVTAVKDGNRDASNWSGKSSFIESVDFALYGNHRHSKEDQWITHGEDEGFVELETDDGMVIRRSRKRGKSTQIQVIDGTRKLVKDEAESHIVQRIGLDKHDFKNTCFFAQKQMARFINADPGERMGIISSWLRLEPLQQCEVVIKDRVRALTERLQTLETDIRGKQSYIDENFAAATGMVVHQSEMIEVLDKKILEKQTEIDALKVEIGLAEDEATDQAVALANWKSVLLDAKEYEKVLAQGKMTRARLEQLATNQEENPAPTDNEIELLVESQRTVESELKLAYAQFSQLQTDAKQKKSLAAGEFDGKCPVACIECPIRDDINAPRKRNLELYNEASTKEQASREAYNALIAQSRQQQSAHSLALSKRRAAEDRANKMLVMETELKSLREMLERLTPAWKRAQDAPSPENGAQAQQELESLRNRLIEASTSLSYMVRIRSTIQAANQVQVDLSKKSMEVNIELGIAREALQIFDRNGAQKRVAESAIGDIEDGANNLLRTCGIDLSLGVQWTREGNGFSSECDDCGAPFPASKRIRKCSNCGAERGPKLVNKLDIVLSNRSGAAEDLAGIAFQLSASAWLRNDRACDWGVAFLDEPTGSLDRANRKGLSTHLANMLRGSYGFSQAFVISHDRASTDAFQGHIEIVSDEKGSVVRVV